MSDATPAPKKKRGPDKRPRKPRGAAREVPPAEGAAPKPPPSTMRSELRMVAGEYLVGILWGLSWGVTWAMGGKLASLTTDERREGAQAAMPLLDRWPIVAQVLQWCGLPVWLVRKVVEKVTFPPKPKKTPPPEQREAPTGRTQHEPAAASPSPAEALSAEELAGVPAHNVRPIRGA